MGNLGIRVTPLKARDQLVKKLSDPDPAERARAELLEQRPVHQLQPLGDGQNFADALRDLALASIGKLIGEVFDRGGVRRDAEQARTGFVMELVGNLPPLLLLHGDELPIEAAVLIARRVEGAGKSVEAGGDDGEFLDLGCPQPRGVMAVLQIEHAAREVRERIKDAAKHHIERGENDGLEPEPHERERRKVPPRLGDLIGRLADDDHGVRPLDANDSDGAAYELRAHQSREPARGSWREGDIAVTLGRHNGELPHRVHDQDAHMAKMLQLQGKHFVELIELSLRREILGGGSNKALGNLERGLDLDTRRRSGIED